MPKVALEVKTAFRDTAAEVYSIADNEFERCQGEFIRAIEAVASARAEWLISVAARRFAFDATTGRRDISYHAPRIDESLFTELRREAGATAYVLFAQPPTYRASNSEAIYVKHFFDGFGIPSHASGNTLTVAEHPDYAKAIEHLESRSDWYLDGDCVLLTDIPPKRVDIVKVAELPPGMKAQWEQTAANRHHAPERRRTQAVKS